MELSLSKVIDRPPPVVWRFFVTDHVRNHPRWDPKMELRQLTEGPIGVGTRIERRHTRDGVPIEGTMEVVEFEPEHAIGMVIRDRTPQALLEIHSRATLEATDGGATLLTFRLTVPETMSSMEPGPIEASLGRIKELVERET